MHRHPRNTGNNSNAANNSTSSTNLYHSQLPCGSSSVSVTTTSENRRLLGKFANSRVNLHHHNQNHPGEPPSSSNNSSPAFKIKNNKAGSVTAAAAATTTAHSTPSAYCRLFCWYHKSSASSASSTTSLTKISANTAPVIPVFSSPNQQVANHPINNQSPTDHPTSHAQQQMITKYQNITTNHQRFANSDTPLISEIVHCANCRRMEVLLNSLTDENQPNCTSKTVPNCLLRLPSLSSTSNNTSDNFAVGKIKPKLTASSSASSTSSSSSNTIVANDVIKDPKPLPSPATKVSPPITTVCACHKITFIFNKLNQELYSSIKIEPLPPQQCINRAGAVCQCHPQVQRSARTSSPHETSYSKPIFSSVHVPPLKHAKSESEICFERQRRRTRKRRLRENSVRTPSTTASSSSDNEDDELNRDLQPHKNNSSLSLMSSSSTTTSTSSTSSSNKTFLSSSSQFSQLLPKPLKTSLSSLGSVLSANTNVLPLHPSLGATSSNSSKISQKQHQQRANKSFHKKQTKSKTTTKPAPPRQTKSIQHRSLTHNGSIGIKRHYSLGKLFEPTTNQECKRQVQNLVPIEQVYRWIQAAKIGNLGLAVRKYSNDSATSGPKNCQHPILTQSFSGASNWSATTTTVGNSAINIAHKVLGTQNHHLPLNPNEPICHCCYYSAITSPVAVVCPDCGEQLPMTTIRKKSLLNNNNNNAGLGEPSTNSPAAVVGRVSPLKPTAATIESIEPSLVNSVYNQRYHDRHPHIIKPLRSRSTCLIDSQSSIKSVPSSGTIKQTTYHSNSCTSLAINPLNGTIDGDLTTGILNKSTFVVSTDATSDATITTTKLTTTSALTPNHHTTEQQQQQHLNCTSKSSSHFSTPTTTPTGQKIFVPRNYHINPRGTNKRLSNPRIHSMQGLTRAKIKTVKITLIVITCYVLCSSPFILVQLWAHWWPGAQETSLYKSSLIAILMLLPSLNSCVNPWIYIYFNPNLVSSFCSLFARKSSNNVIGNSNTGNTCTGTNLLQHNNVIHKNSREQVNAVKPAGGGATCHKAVHKTLTDESQQALPIVSDISNVEELKDKQIEPTIDRTAKAVMKTQDHNGCHRQIV